MKHITSPDNPLIKSVVQLTTKKGRQQAQQFLSEGIRTSTTIIQSGIDPIYIFSTQEIIDKTPFFLDSNYPIILVTQKIIKKISPVATSSGIVCVFPIVPQPSYDFIKEGIVLANIQDPGNMGTLIRTCISFGKKTVILVEGVDPWNPKVVQASTGTLAMADIFLLSWQELLVHKKKLRLVALAVENGKNPQKIDFDEILLIIGSEAHGIPPSWLKTCDDVMTLPMPGKTESLNASTAGSIAMYLAWIHGK